MPDEGRSRLGRGLAALIGDVGAATATSPSARAISAACRSNICGPIREIRARNFSDAELDELAASIKERGIIQPVVVRPVARREGYLRDHRRRAALARGAARGPA